MEILCLGPGRIPKMEKVEIIYGTSCRRDEASRNETDEILTVRSGFIGEVQINMLYSQIE